MTKEIDILERKLNDYRRLFDEAEVAITILDQEGHFIDCNKAYYDLFGYMDKPILDNFHPNYLSPEKQPDGSNSYEKANKMIQLALAQGKNSFEWMHKKLDGYEFLSHVTLDVIVFNGKDVVRGTIHDISEQRKLERHVRERTSELDIKTRELERLAITDSLTGLYNRIRLDKVLVQEDSRFKRYQRVFGAALIDVDYFKRVNDKYGHQRGDQVLIEMSMLLKRYSREVDTVGRWGGEEFLIIMPETNLEGVRVQAEKLRMHIESYFSTKVPAITASFGIATIRKKDSIKGFLTRIDNALYDAKNKGRNLVSVAE